MAACMECQKPLTLLIEPDEDDEDQSIGGLSANAGSYVDDDVQLNCGCHFHWQCLLDAYSVSECPKCGQNLITTTSSREQQLLCNLKNEGGLQERLDILPILTEESYLKAYPEERRCRAFLEFCGEGDIEAIVDLLGDEEDDNDEDVRRGDRLDVLKYQDQIGSLGTGLHVAIQNQKIEVVWLLLLLASSLDLGQFPAEVMKAAQNLGIQRGDQSREPDIRSLKDSEGKTAEEQAANLGGVWDEWVHSGRLRPPET